MRTSETAAVAPVAPAAPAAPLVPPKAPPPGPPAGTPVAETPATPVTDVATDAATDAATDVATDVAKAEPPPARVVDALFAGRGDLPVWATELLADQEDAGAEYDLTDEQINALPIEAKKLVAVALRRGRAAAAELKIQQEAAKAAAAVVEKRALQAKQLEADAFKWARDPKLKEAAEKMAPEGDPPDPNSPEGIRWLARTEAAEMIKGWLSSIQEADARVTEASTQAEQDAVTAAQRKELGEFVKANEADFKVPAIRDAIVALVQRKEPLTAQEAHALVMGKMALDAHTDRSAAMEQARRRVAPGGRAGDVIPEMPSHVKGNTEAELDWYSSNPAAEARDLERARRSLSVHRR